MAYIFLQSVEGLGDVIVRAVGVQTILEAVTETLLQLKDKTNQHCCTTTTTNGNPSRAAI